MADKDNENREADDGLVEEVETLKGRVDNIEGRVDDLHDMFETYIEDDDE